MTTPFNKQMTPTAANAETSEELSIVCDMSAMTPEQHQRHQQVAEQLLRSRRSIRELPDGYAFEYPADPTTCAALAEFMSLEHLCCPFFRLTLEIEPGHDAVWLRFTGSGEIKQFIKSEIGIG